ncbi:hypothetical protein GCM10027187_61290 [Streptosporangium sandarakinum]
MRLPDLRPRFHRSRLRVPVRPPGRRRPAPRGGADVPDARPLPPPAPPDAAGRRSEAEKRRWASPERVRIAGPAQAADLIEATHRVCPCSNAAHGNIEVVLTVNGARPRPAAA